MSALALILANLVTVAFAEWQSWNVIELLWIYWIQGIFMGLFTWCRILDLKQFSTEGLVVDGKQLEATPQTQQRYAWAFLAGYGGFHLLYLFGWLNRLEKPSSETHDIFFFVCILAFMLNHAFSYFYNRRADMKGTPNLGAIFGYPMVRVVLMYGIMVIGINMVGLRNVSESRDFLLLVLLLKTLADVLMHMAQRYDFRHYQTTH